MFKYLILLFFLGLEPITTNAYLDPGTGSFIIQIVIAAIAGVSFTLKIYWKKAAGWVASTFKRERNKKDGQ